MDLKERPNHKKYIQILRQMTPEQRLLKSFELSEFTVQLFIHGLHKRFPDLSKKPKNTPSIADRLRGR